MDNDDKMECATCKRIQPESEQGENGKWMYIAGTGGKVVCSNKCLRKLIDKMNN